MTETTPTKSPAAPQEPPSVIIRPWPKVVFLYPIFLCATAFWLISALGGHPPAGEMTKFKWMGDAFLLVTFLNFLVFAFDFSRIKSITIFFGIVAAVFALFWADQNWQVLGVLRGWMDAIDSQMNTWFYGIFSVMMGGILLLVLVNTRFNYYEVNHREILHHHGYLGDVKRWSTEGLEMNKEIYDVAEYVLLRSGRLIFSPMTSKKSIVVDNVYNVNRAEKAINDLLSHVAVRINQRPGPG